MSVKWSSDIWIIERTGVAPDDPGFPFPDTTVVGFWLGNPTDEVESGLAIPIGFEEPEEVLAEELDDGLSASGVLRVS